MTKLLPCPFCGTKPHINIANLVQCSNYKCSFSRGPCWLHIDDWNHRHLTIDETENETDCGFCENNRQTGYDYCSYCGNNLNKN